LLGDEQGGFLAGKQYDVGYNAGQDRV